MRKPTSFRTELLGSLVETLEASLKARNETSNPLEYVRRNTEAELCLNMLKWADMQPKDTPPTPEPLNPVPESIINNAVTLCANCMNACPTCTCVQPCDPEARAQAEAGQ